LARLRKVASLAELDYYAHALEYLPLTTPVIRQATELWAQSRQQGRPLADPKELDGDVILAAQLLSVRGTDIVVATTNVGHLEHFVTAKRWQDIF
jgi:predicted nucleic acid-binding protein